MNKSDLKGICISFEKIVSKIPDRRVNSIYAEYYVAHELAKRGLSVQIGDERAVANSDIYLPESEIRIEVKSAVIDKNGWWATFSFSKNQLTYKYDDGKIGKFDYCVCIPFKEKHKDDSVWYGYDITGAFILSMEEIKKDILNRGEKILKAYKNASKEEKNKIKNEWAKHPETNNLLLYIKYRDNKCKELDLKGYKNESYFGSTYLGTSIEEDIHEHPENYIDKWDKIPIS